jgi:hypothetical protein
LFYILPETQFFSNRILADFIYWFPTYGGGFYHPNVDVETRPKQDEFLWIGG